MLGVIDNDVLIKLSCYKLLGSVVSTLGGVPRSGVLGSARYVVWSRFEKDAKIQDAAGARREFDEFLQHTTELEPTSVEVDLATEIEELATAANVELDFGESQLCAIAIIRECVYLLTGDKRAIEGLGTILPDLPRLAALSGQVYCLEQAILALWSSIGPAELKTRVCSERLIDKALSICLSCSGTSEPDQTGLLSYIRDAQSRAPSLALIIRGGCVPGSGVVGNDLDRCS